MAKLNKSLTEMLDMDNEKGEVMDSIMTIPALIFKARNDAHLTHLRQRDKTLATHKALEMFYDGVIDLLDTYIETTMGIYPDSCLDEVEESKIIDNPIQYFKNLYNTISKSRTSVKESFLQNQIDELQQLIAHTLYRLQFITT